jgi:hypothetical protein
MSGDEEIHLDDRMRSLSIRLTFLCHRTRAPGGSMRNSQTILIGHFCLECIYEAPGSIIMHILIFSSVSSRKSIVVQILVGRAHTPIYGRSFAAENDENLENASNRFHSRTECGFDSHLRPPWPVRKGSTAQASPSSCLTQRRTYTSPRSRA